MKIIRPYGQSRTETDGDRFRRVLQDRTPQRECHDIPAYASGHDELVIAQWVSLMDKIATKPQPGKGATQAQRSFRDELGKAAWDVICKNDRINPQGQNDERLKALWYVKTHPYGSANHTQGKGANRGNKAPEPRVKGRWYKRFAGDVDPDQADFAAVAAAMDRHLHVAAKRPDGNRPDKRHGVIESRALSIKSNVLALPEATVEKPVSQRTADRYFDKGDVAEEIFRAASNREGGKNGKKKGSLRLPDAAKILHRQWARVFADTSGEAMDVRTARDKHPELFDLHMAVRGVYTRILKRRRAPKKDTGAMPSKPAPAAPNLPRDRHALLRLIEHRRNNRELAGLIRAGKIVHYGQSGMSANTPFLTSDGQSAIKRSEAFVRIWRHTIALADLALRDWARMKKPASEIGDVLGKKTKVEEVTGRKNFDRQWHDEKMKLLLGARADLIDTDENIQKKFLQSLLRAAIELRNASFHFRERAQFLQALRKIGEYAALNDDVKPFVLKIYEADATGRVQRLRDTLAAVNAHYYFDAARNNRIIGLLGGQNAPSSLPLPRFRRVLSRASNTLKGNNALTLPEPANRVMMEQHPALRCRYVLLKLLYEGPFRNWLAGRATRTVNEWIRRSVDRSTQAAKAMNARNDKERQIIAAKAEGLPGLADGQTIGHFFFDLSRETASEMRVQRGYGHDGAAARRQAGYIDDFLCDVVARAFDAYIREEDLVWVAELEPVTPLPDRPVFDLENAQMPQNREPFDDWQAMLYLFLHLVPVSEIGGLFHQLAKWEITARRGNDLCADDAADLMRLKETLLLYLDMHDAKFDGGESLTGCEAFSDLFCDRAAFEAMFPAVEPGEYDGRIPKRGLREIMRFGHRDLAGEIAGDEKITGAEVKEYLGTMSGDGDKSLALIHQRRADIHDRWCNDKDLSAADLKDYVSAVRRTADHRDRAARVSLSGLVFQHRLVMKVLGRLADYAGLFERDLYFAALGLLHRNGLKPEEVFEDTGLLERGPIFRALEEKNLKEPGWLRDELERLFGMPRSGLPLFDRQKGLRKIRNDAAHFNCLHDSPRNIDLTACINDVRRLMSYDRKMRNAVSKSVKEMLAREKLTILWHMSEDHDLCDARIGSAQATHLGGKTYVVTQSGKRYAIRENLHAQTVLEAVAKLFGGKVDDITDDVRSLDLDSVDWSARPKKHKPGRHQARPKDGKNRNRKRKRS